MTQNGCKSDSVVVELEEIDFAPFLNDPSSAEALAECDKVAKTLIEYGVLTVKDPRVLESYNSKFIDMIEEYFEQPLEVKMEDVRPEYHYQVGATPNNVEDPKCKTDEICQNLIKTLPEESRPMISEKPDPKWRFFWKMGKIPPTTKFAALNAEPVQPKAFPQWTEIMNTWGNYMHSSVSLLAQMLAVGLNLPQDTFDKMAEFGPHLLAPTATDLKENGKLDTVLAGFHYDLNFLTIHGKSRYPGLNVWARNGARKISVKVPDGCLLVQAGKQLEWLTGGKILAGYHEVVVNTRTIQAIEEAKNQGRSLWRISSTFFYHIGSDQLLKPLLEGQESDKVINEKYPPTLCGDYVSEELSFIKLRKE